MTVVLVRSISVIVIRSCVPSMVIRVAVLRECRYKRSWKSPE